MSVWRRRFKQVDVFSAEACRGNPLAVVLDGEGMSDAEMRQFASWTNLSETTFLLPPTRAEADYRVRIFTTTQELPFAGHPTLGSCHAWLEAGGAPRAGGVIVQECGAGLVSIQRHESRLAFAAPPLRMGAVDESILELFALSLGIARTDILAAQWLVNGPRWIGMLLRSAETVLALAPKYAELKDFDFGFVGPLADGGFEVRAFPFSDGPIEDPVTGSLNAGIGEWLIGAGVTPTSYVARQGTAIGRAGRVYVSQVEGRVWVGGESRTLIDGVAVL